MFLISHYTSNFFLFNLERKKILSIHLPHTSHPCLRSGSLPVGAVQKVKCPVTLPRVTGFVVARRHARKASGAPHSARYPWHCKQGEGKALLCYYRVSEVRWTEGVSVLTSPNYSAVQLQELSLHSDFTVRLAITYDCAPTRAVSKNKPKPPFFFFF